MPLLRIKQSLLLHAIVDAGMIPFAAYTAAETASAFQWAGQPEESNPDTVTHPSTLGSA